LVGPRFAQIYFLKEKVQISRRGGPARHGRKRLAFEKKNWRTRGPEKRCVFCKGNSNALGEP